MIGCWRLNANLLEGEEARRRLFANSNFTAEQNAARNAIVRKLEMLDEREQNIVEGIILGMIAKKGE